MKVVALGLILVVILAGLGFWWWTGQVGAVSPGNEQKAAIVVAQNQTGTEIVNSLAAQGLIKSSLAAKIFLYVSHQQNKLQAGSFVVSPGLTLAELFQVLTGPAIDVWVTIPEGWRREQIAVRLQESLGGEATSNFSLPSFMVGSQNLEGRLFPDTYLIPRSASASDVIKIMTDNFASKAKIDPQTQKDVLILASLVEREGITDSDRPVIAGILAKRLQAGWPLQVDATVQYAQDNDRCKTNIETCKYWEPVTNSKFPSTYNTYLHTGLPPAPISNPGAAAIAASAIPTTNPYWYYLHDANGEIHYAKTLEEHQANIDKYLR